MSSYCIEPYMDGFYTQRAFHIVYERAKRTSKEKVMVFRSWHNRAHSLLSSARRAQPKEVSSASHSSSLMRLATHSSSLLSSVIHSSSLLSSATHSSSHLSSTRRGQLIPRELGQKRSALPQEVSSAKRAQLCPKRSARPEELSSAQRGQLSQKSSATQLILSNPSE